MLLSGGMVVAPMVEIASARRLIISDPVFLTALD
jgi:hypothetical protein